MNAINHLEKLSGLTILPQERKLISNSGVEQKLSRTEMELFNFLYHNPNKTISKPTLMELIWNFQIHASSNTLEVHLCKLRKKLVDLLTFNPIRTIHGLGYSLERG